jgi:hypothetical protein
LQGRIKRRESSDRRQARWVSPLSRSSPIDTVSWKVFRDAHRPAKKNLEPNPVLGACRACPIFSSARVTSCWISASKIGARTPISPFECLPVRHEPFLMAEDVPGRQKGLADALGPLAALLPFVLFVGHGGVWFPPPREAVAEDLWSVS